MCAKRASTKSRALEIVRSHFDRASRARLARVHVEDQAPTGEAITIDGEKLLNFGSCAYLGLNVDSRLKDAAIAAIQQYGPVYSSSTAYTSVDLYADLKDRLEQIFGGSVVVPTTTTLGHLSALPVLVGADDLVLIDQQAHASVHLATQVLRGDGIPVDMVRHSDVAQLADRLDTDADRYERVWYLADGVYSMYGDFAPVKQIAALLGAYDNLHVYYDDAHGIGWRGVHGRGHVLHEMALNDRVVIAASLSKSFGTGGAVLVFSDPVVAQDVQWLGATFTFSGPLHPAELGAAVASADIHLSSERDVLAADLDRQMDFVRELLISHKLPVRSLAKTPIWNLRIGPYDNALEFASRLKDEGFYVNLAGFPAVPLREAGIRFTQTLYHSDDHLERFVEAMARHVPELAVRPRGDVDLREARTLH